MQLPAVPPEEWTDLTLNFEAIQAQPLIARGSFTAVFTASALAAVNVITHGLPVIPTAIAYGVTAQGYDAFSTAVGTTTFTANGFTTANNAVTSNITMYWIAIG